MFSAFAEARHADRQAYVRFDRPAANRSISGRVISRFRSNPVIVAFSNLQPMSISESSAPQFDRCTRPSKADPALRDHTLSRPEDVGAARRRVAARIIMQEHIASAIRLICRDFQERLFG
jgi:hypothetical protein